MASRRITSGEVAAALKAAGADGATLDVPLGKPDDPYIELFTGLLTPAAIGGNLLGLRNFEDYRAPPAARGAGDFHRLQRSL